MNKKNSSEAKKMTFAIFEPERDIKAALFDGDLHKRQSKDYAQKLKKGVSGLIWYIPITILASWIALWTYGWTSPAASFYSLAVADRYIPYPNALLDLTQIPWTPLSWTIGVLSELLRVMPFWLGLFSLRQIFHNYAQGDVFSLENTYHYLWIGRLSMINSFVQPFSRGLLIFSATFSNPAGATALSLGVGSISFISLFMGYIVNFIAITMADALNMQNEQNLTV